MRKGTQTFVDSNEIESGNNTDSPLVLDLDGTLLRTNLLLETMLAYVKANPLHLINILLWLWKGRAYLKRQLAENVRLDWERLPVDKSVLTFAKDAADRGRPVYIATGANELLVERLRHLFPFVRGVIASDATVNMKGERKAEELSRRFPEGFDYAGDSIADLEVWRRARGAILVNVSSLMERKVAGLAQIAGRIRRPSVARELVRGLRPHQWLKNTLVFVPMILAGQLGNVPALYSTSLAFVAMCLIASSTYLLNDMFDLADDRRHWSKRDRPLASGRLPLNVAATAVPLGLLSGLVLGGSVSFSVAAVLLAYLAITLSYSLGIKRIPLLDGFVLAVLFTQRLALGVVAAAVTPSAWLFVFSMFLFGSLCFAKRHAEIGRVIDNRGDEVSGRGYRAGDLSLVLSMGIVSGVGAVLILMLYLIEDAFNQDFYNNSAMLWGLPPLFFLYIARVWLITQRHEMMDDPLDFTLNDWPSLAIVALSVFCFGLAWLGPSWM